MLSFVTDETIEKLTLCVLLCAAMRVAGGNADYRNPRVPSACCARFSR
jgi:hypothetical protein